MSDDEVIDVRSPEPFLTPAELALLQTVVDRGVVDVAEIGRCLGASDEGVFATMRSIAEKLDEFRYIAENRTPPLGIEVPGTDGRRPKHRRPLKPDAAS